MIWRRLARREKTAMSNAKPNVLMISADHWPASFLGCAGKDNLMTPTLDSLARDGVRFSDFYSECPVCIPARRSLMTGLTPRTHGDRVYDDYLKMPDVPTLAQTFRDNGYQAYAVGKLHVYPQRDRIGFDDVLLQEEGRYEFGVVDDYQTWLGEEGYPGQEYMHGMGNNTYYTRNWHLPEYTHPTNWTTTQTMRMMKRKDPTRPAFYYASYIFPHPPLVPLEAYWNMYADAEIDAPVRGDWLDDSYIMQSMTEMRRPYSDKETRLAKRAFYAQCTHIDHQIRMLLGCLRENNLLDNTLIVFLSDHGDMLFDHDMVAKRCFYENASHVPLILSGNPIAAKRGAVDNRLGCMADVMPTILDICGLDIPAHVEGMSLWGGAARPILYGEVGEGAKATRMVRDARYKLIYYPSGNVSQLFDLADDPRELRNLADVAEMRPVRERLEAELVGRLYNKDTEWVAGGRLIGLPAPAYEPKADYGLYNQRGLHWPPPSGYSNIGKNA